MISEPNYLKWQKWLVSKAWFGRLWGFWAVDSVLLLFPLLIYFSLTGRLRIVLGALASAIFGRYLVSPLIYLFYKKARPYQSLKFALSRTGLFSRVVERNNSFPSDHATGLMAIAVFTVLFFPAWGAALFLLALFNGIGRVILGYHYPIDVISGWVLGTVCGVLAFHFFPALI